MPLSLGTGEGVGGAAALKLCCALAVGLLAAGAAPFGRQRAVEPRPAHGPRAADLSAARVADEGGWPADFRTAAHALTPQSGPLPPVTTSRRIYKEPGLPALPAAGGKFREPVFGTELMRATDERDGAAPGLGTYYSHWPTFNSDNTLLLIRRGTSGDAILKRFDPVRFELRGAAEPLPASIPNSGAAPSWETSMASASASIVSRRPG